MSSLLPLLLLGGAVFMGAAMQRVSGMGFALIASPFIVALLGPFHGVLLVNVLGAVTSSAVLLSVLRQVEWRRALLLLVPAALAMVPGALVARLVPAPILETVIGSLVILALAGSLFAADAVRTMGRAGGVLAGGVSGFMSVTAGVGGPAIVAYAVATRWPHQRFAATAQLYFLGVAALSLLFKWSLPVLSMAQWAVCVGALALGILAGHFLSRRVRARTARVLVIVLALVGAIVIIAKGMVEWVAA